MSRRQKPVGRGPEVIRTPDAIPVTSLKVFSGRRDTEPLGSIVLPVRDHVNAATVMSMIYTDLSFAGVPGVDWNIIQGSILTTQRNMAVQRIRGDWLLFIDDDMVWQPNAFSKLVAAREEHDLDMIGGLCFRRTPPYQPTLYMREQPTAGAYNFMERWGEDEIVEVDATGMAFLLIHKRVFEMIAGSPMPPYEERTYEGAPPPEFFKWTGRLGEDLRFCQDAKAAGARIWVHTGIPIGHIGEVEITHRDFLQALATRDELTYDDRLKVNDGMGLPTVSRDEARERLGW